MASLPPGKCCTTGIQHEGSPKGTIAGIGNYQAYLSRPSQPNSEAIIIISDIFGHNYLNIQLIADSFAAKGYLTIVPDLFNGDAIAPIEFDNGKVDLQEWLGRHDTTSIDSVVGEVIRYLREDLSFDKVAGVGYCFGAKYVVRNLKEGLLDAGYLAHPSFVTSEELSSITKPLSIAAAEIDPIFTTEKRLESEQILADLKVPYQINLYGSVSHGFALRGDLTIKEVKFATDSAFEQAVAWFKFWI